MMEFFMYKCKINNTVTCNENIQHLVCITGNKSFNNYVKYIIIFILCIVVIVYNYITDIDLYLCCIILLIGICINKFNVFNHIINFFLFCMIHICWSVSACIVYISDIITTCRPINKQASPLVPYNASTKPELDTINICTAISSHNISHQSTIQINIDTINIITNLSFDVVGGGGNPQKTARTSEASFLVS